MKKHCIKKAIAVLLTLIMTAAIMCVLPLSVSADSLYIRKVVSVVYDDSGSMYGDKWAYANYAMQAFCGMMNSEDKLFVTYMSHSQSYKNYKPQEVNLSANGIQNSIDSIRNHVESGSTPYGAVEIAYNKLKSVSDSNPNTQYWLVVITDGAFDELNAESDENRVKILNKNFKDYTSSVMPNGTNPQVTFLGIGGAVSPDENQKAGIYTYSAENASEIINAMSEMADKISGRTRLQGNDIKKIDDTTIQVSSSIPLLNIAVFTQGCEATVKEAVYGNELDIPISRKAELSYPNYSDLVGSAYLLGDSQRVIGAGTYDITFKQTIDLENVIILFEPALEMRMTISVNGNEISDYTELENVSEGDKVSVSCKIYEMGTDSEIDASLMPPGTKFEVVITEDGNIVEQSADEDMILTEYTLTNKETEIRASVIIEGFNPIEYSEKFTPVKYEPKILYTIIPSFGSDIRSIKYDKINSNKDLTICFTVYADGVALTDSSAVKALNPVISATPSGNYGTVSYTNDGKIVFTPNATGITSDEENGIEAEVTCTIDDGTKASEKYSVLTAEYQVVSVGTSEAIRKNEFYGNQVGASFYILKDGVKLDKSAVENNISVALNEEYDGLKTGVSVAADGTITITPYSDKERTLNFWKWLTNWLYYFRLPDADLVITMSHSLGTSSSIIKVVGASINYCILNVYLPLFLIILFVATFAAYWIRYYKKAKFASNAVLYVGSIALNWSTHGTHRLELQEIHLNQYNKFKNLWNPFKELTVSVSGISITAANGNLIICNEPFPWYAHGVKPKSNTIRIQSPKDIVNYCQEKDELIINEIKASNVMDEQNRIISQDDSVYYFARAELTYKNIGTRRIEVIDNAVVFCYSTIQN